MTDLHRREDGAAVEIVSLEEKLQRVGSPVQMLRNGQLARLPFPMRGEYSNWRDEQRAWAQTAAIFDQSHHMTDVNFRGPDALRLLSDLGVNSFANFGKNRAKQFVACNEDGFVIGDAILFGLDDEEYSLVGPPFVSRWACFQAEIGDYDVVVTRDEATPLNRTGRRFFRYQLQGPDALAIVASAADALPEIKTFHVGDFSIAGTAVRALNHSMTRKTGLEIWGTFSDSPQVLDALLAAGQPYGLRQAGAIAYSTTALESGWIGLQLPAIYSGDGMKPYRQWLSADSAESVGSIGGSFVSDDIEDYYTTPWDLGYGRLVKFDHSFIGRAALEKLAARPHRRKVWLRWDDQDVTRLIASSLFDDEAHRAKYLDAPYTPYSTFPADSVLIGEECVGLAVRSGYTVNVGAWFSLAMIDEARAVDGTQVTVVWGEENGGTSKPTVERHAQFKIRATVSTSPLA